MRVVAVSIVLLFLWRDNVAKFVYPRDVPATPGVSVPDALGKSLVAEIPVNGILPADRLYYSAFYDSLGAVLGMDGQRETHIIDTTEKFRRFHSGSLDLSIEKKSVGKYPGLGESIDRVFALAAAGVDPAGLRTPADVEKAMADGLTPRPMTNALRDRLRAASAALAWKFAIHGE